jgi:hypothetical protein
MGVVDGGQCGLQLFHIGRGIWPNENISLPQLFFLSNRVESVFNI